MPETMKAALIHRCGDIKEVVIETVSIPEPLSDEIQISVRSSGINPVDWKILHGFLQTRIEHRFPLILGWDVAGVVSAVGTHVTTFKKGDAVFAYCRKEVIQEGSFAEYICVKETAAAFKPKKLSFAQAAAIPLSALTAWQSIYDTAHLRSKEKVLIHAGAGGVGGFAIQFAKLVNALVITTASAPNTSYVKSLGADQVIDYTKEAFAEKIHKLYPLGVDVVFDTIGGSSLSESCSIIKEGGRLVSIVSPVDTVSHERRLAASYVFVHPDGKALHEISHLIDADKLKCPTIEEFAFEEIHRALRKSKEGHVQGKLILNISN